MNFSFLGWNVSYRSQISSGTIISVWDGQIWGREAVLRKHWTAERMCYEHWTMKQWALMTLCYNFIIMYAIRSL